MLKCKALLKTKFKCVYVTMCSLVMSLFSCDYMKTEIDQLKYQQCFNWFTCVQNSHRYQPCFNWFKCVQNSHSAWFLDGRTSTPCWLVENFPSNQLSGDGRLFHKITLPDLINNTKWEIIYNYNFNKGIYALEIDSSFIQASTTLSSYFHRKCFVPTNQICSTKS